MLTTSLLLLDTSGFHNVLDSHSIQIWECAKGWHLGWAWNWLHPLHTEGCRPKSQPQRSQGHQICQQGATQTNHGYFYYCSLLFFLQISCLWWTSISILDSGDGTLITPWFKLIVDNFLPHWWSNLASLHNCTDHNKIHKY